MVELDTLFVKEIHEHGLRELPNEACGLIAGTDGSAVKVFTMRNMDESPMSYRLDPTEQLRVTREIEETGSELWGIYHTHTHTEAYPSETDRDRARWVQPFYPELYYVLMSLSDRDSPVVRAFRITDGEVAEEELTIR
jgi:[CysO sulfur-carrier protein]-S-L-cysteine hydrolase